MEYTENTPITVTRFTGNNFSSFVTDSRKTHTHRAHEMNRSVRCWPVAALLVLQLAAASVTGQSMSFPENAADNGTTTGRSDGGPTTGNRNGKNLFSWLGSFADEDADPYLAAANGACLQGDMTECFKARSLSGLGEFFVRDAYRLNDNVRVVRLPGDDDDGYGGRSSRAFEFSTEQRPDDTEWDKLVKFAMRKVERFLRSAAVEVHVPDELTEGGRYSPRFIDEISSELDTLEDKKASVISEFTRLPLIRCDICLFFFFVLVISVEHFTVTSQSECS